MWKGREVAGRWCHGNHGEQKWAAVSGAPEAPRQDHKVFFQSKGKNKGIETSKTKLKPKIIAPLSLTCLKDKLINSLSLSILTKCQSDSYTLST